MREGQCGDPTPKPTKTPIFCTENYDPVCGAKDGAAKTYSNACFAKADGATVDRSGRMPEAVSAAAHAFGAMRVRPPM